MSNRPTIYAEHFKDAISRFDGNDIHVNFGIEILFNESGDRPETDATVDLGLIDTRALTSIIDAQRTEKGFLPMLPNDGEYDENGWYDFYISLNDQSCTRVDAKITAIVQSEAAPDDKACYEIELTEAEQRIVYASIDYDLQNTTEKTAEEYLALARQYLEEDKT